MGFHICGTFVWLASCERVGKSVWVIFFFVSLSLVLSLFEHCISLGFYVYVQWWNKLIVMFNSINFHHDPMLN